MPPLPLPGMASAPPLAPPAPPAAAPAPPASSLRASTIVWPGRGVHGRARALAARVSRGAARARAPRGVWRCLACPAARRRRLRAKHPRATEVQNACIFRWPHSARARRPPPPPCTARGTGRGGVTGAVSSARCDAGGLRGPGGGARVVGTREGWHSFLGGGSDRLVGVQGQAHRHCRSLELGSRSAPPGPRALQQLAICGRWGLTHAARASREAREAASLASQCAAPRSCYSHSRQVRSWWCRNGWDRAKMRARASNASCWDKEVLGS